MDGNLIFPNILTKTFRFFLKKKSFEYLENGPLSVLKPVVAIIDG